MKKMLKKLKKFVGETLIESLISLTVLMMSGIAAVALIISSIQTTALSENYLIAQNLAVEAVEAVKNIRDTNWLNYPLYKEYCWLVANPLDDAIDTQETCEDSAADKIEPGDYIPLRNDIGDSRQWKLGPITTAALNISKDTGGGIDPSDEDYRLYLNTATNSYSYSGIEEEKTKFFRSIEVSKGYIDPTTPVDEIIFTVHVQWYEGQKFEEFQYKNVSLTNYSE